MNATRSGAVARPLLAAAAVVVVLAATVAAAAPAGAAGGVRFTSGPPQPTRTDVGTFIFSGAPPGVRYQCQRDGGSWRPCTSPLRMTGFRAGAHEVRVRAAGGYGAAPTPARYGWTVRPTSARPPRNLNVVIINMDDMRASGTLGVMPRTRAWFARGETTFSHAFVSDPNCCPSRSSLFSGRYVHNHGNRNNQTTMNLDHAGTLAAYLHEVGYQTGMVGKLLNQWPPRVAPPSYDRWAVTVNAYDNAFFGTDQGPLTARYGTTEVGRQGLRMLDAFEKRDGTPFLLYLAPSAPHEPFTAEARYAGADVGPCALGPAARETDRSDKPAWVQRIRFAPTGGCLRRQAQLRTLLSADDMVDKVMTRLRRLGEDGNTLAVFTSDNGTHWAEHGLSSKFSPYTESIQVPLMVRWPGRLAAGATERRLVSNVDVLPSVLAAAGVAPALRHPVDGKAFLGRTGLSSQSRSELFVEFFRDAYKPTYPDWASVRTRTSQLILWYDAEGAVAFREYYDLAKDPRQLVNLLADGSTGNDPRIGALRKRLDGYRRCRGTVGANPCP